MEGLGAWPQLLGTRLSCSPATSLCRDLDVFDLTLRRRNRQSVFAQTFKVERNGFADLGFNLGDGGTCSDAAWKVRDVSGVIAFGLLNHDGVSHSARTGGPPA